MLPAGDPAAPVVHDSIGARYGPVSPAVRLVPQWYDSASAAASGRRPANASKRGAMSLGTKARGAGGGGRHPRPPRHPFVRRDRARARARVRRRATYTGSVAVVGGACSGADVWVTRGRDSVGRDGPRRVLLRGGTSILILRDPEAYTVVYESATPASSPRNGGLAGCLQGSAEIATLALQAHGPADSGC